MIELIKIRWPWGDKWKNDTKIILEERSSLLFGGQRRGLYGVSGSCWFCLTLSIAAIWLISISWPEGRADSREIVWYDIIWYNLIWYDMILHDMTWYDTIWYGMIWYDMIWVVIIYDMRWYYIICHVIWYDVIWYDMIWYGVIWFEIIWHDMIWYNMIWYSLYTISLSSYSDPRILFFSLVLLYKRNVRRIWSQPWQKL